MQNDKSNTILVPSDFTKIGDHAIDNAIKIAKDLNFSICVLHVINKKTKKNLQKENKPIEHVNEKLTVITDSIKQKHNIEATYIAREGSIFSVIGQVAEEINANYIIIGTHGKKGIQFLLGSFALKVVKSSPVPIFIIQKPPGQENVNNIIFPLDLEEGSKQKVKWAVTLHKQFNAKFHIFLDNQSDEFSQNRIKGDLHQVKKIFDKHGVHYTETFSTKGKSYYKELINYSKKINSSFIMLSTDPDKSTIHPFGSTHEQIIYNQEKISVMCINLHELRILVGGL